MSDTPASLRLPAYVRAPGETQARRIIKDMADQMLQTMDGVGYAFVMVEPKASG